MEIPVSVANENQQQILSINMYYKPYHYRPTSLRTNRIWVR